MYIYIDMLFVVHKRLRCVAYEFKSLAFNCILIYVYLLSFDH